jgi:ketosteroid isomerase-like protein
MRAAALALAVTACTAASSTEATMSTRTNESQIRDRNRRNVEAYFALQAAMDLDPWFELWHPDGVFNIPYAPTGFPDRIEGRARLEPIYRQLFAGYSALRYRDLRIEPLLDPGRFVATWTTEADRVAGGTYVNHLIALFFLDDHGKIVRYDEYFDPRAFGSVAPTSR